MITPFTALLWLSLRAIQQVIPNAINATPAMWATINATGLSSADPNKKETSFDGSKTSSRPVIDSMTVVNVNKFFM